MATLHPPTGSAGDPAARAERAATWTAYGVSFLVGAGVGAVWVAVDASVDLLVLPVVVAVIIVAVIALPQIEKTREQARRKAAESFFDEKFPYNG